MGAIVQMILQLVLGIVGSVASAIPGKAETTMRKDAFAGREALKHAQGGGYTSAQRQRLRSEALSGVSAQQQQALSQLARGSATDASGNIDQAAIRDIYKSSLGAQNQAMSNINAQDANEYQRRVDANKQDLINAYNMGQARKSAALSKTQTGGLSTGQSSGQDSRQQDASAISSAASAIGGK